MRRTKLSWVGVAVKFILAVVIAASLIKIAFFSHENADSGTVSPSAQFSELTVRPEIATVSNEMSLTGTIIADDATAVRSQAEGTVSHVYVADGAGVEAGAPIIQVRHETPGEDHISTDADGNETVIPARPLVSYIDVPASATGTLSLSVFPGQNVAIGESIGSIQPNSYHVQANMQADQMYRLTATPGSATVTIKDGPAPFECAEVKISSAFSPSSEQNGQAQGNMNGSSVYATCAIPSDVRVFAGLQATLDIKAGEAKDALTLPTTAVQGRFGEGYVFKPTDNPNKPEKVKVTLGVTDGTRIVITEGISEEDDVLEFVPGSEDECDPMTGEGCQL